MQLTSQQNEAIDRIRDRVSKGQRLITLSGAAGTGKTTIIKELINALGEDRDLVVCTPTNKAAQVLISKGIRASTFFKQFYILEEKVVQGAKPKFISVRRWLETRAGDQNLADVQHLLPDGKRYFVDVLIIDEASMVSSRMVSEMQSMCRHLVLVGDRNQLPPVGDRDTPAGFFASTRPDAELTEVLRQAEGSSILELATEIRNDGQLVRSMTRGFEPEDEFKDWVNCGARVIAFSNNERRRINQACRRILGFTEAVPEIGDRVIVTNNYNDEFINGTEALVLDFEWDGSDQLAIVTLQSGKDKLIAKMLMSSFIEDQPEAQQIRLSENWAKRDPDVDRFLELTFGYCLTAHKAQGSEWPKVVVVNQLNLIRKIMDKNSNAGMPGDEYSRRWFYTAVTRAKQDLAIVPTHWAQSYSRGSE